MAELTHAQLDVAAAFFRLQESDGFVVVGGAALLALELIDRPTEDLDFFTDDATRVSDAARALIEVAAHTGWSARELLSTPTFYRLEFTVESEFVRVDLAVDSPPRRETITGAIGPTLDPLELAGRKLLALFDRAAPRDFVDTYQLTNRFGSDAVVRIASEIDTGFDLAYFVAALDRAVIMSDADFPIDAREVAAVREWASRWAKDIRNGDVADT